MEAKGEDLHCFIDHQEVPLKECDLEHQDSNDPDSIDDKPDQMGEEISQWNKVPKGSSIVSITIKEGSIVEKVFKTTEGKNISIKSSDLKK